MMMKIQRKHSFLVLGTIGALVALLVNNQLSGSNLARAQMTLWTVMVFAFMAIQLHRSVGRPRQAWVAMALVVVHFIGLIRLRHLFPLDNMILGFILMMAEALILIFLYARIGQTVDPQGPFGLSESELEARKMRLTRRPK